MFRKPVGEPVAEWVPASQRALAPVDADAPKAPRWARLSVAVSVLVTGLLNFALPDLMALTGRRGTEFIALALTPLFAVSLRRGVWSWLRPELLPLVITTAMLALSLFIGDFFTEGAVKVLVTLSGVAWAVVVLDEQQTLALVARWGTWLCATGLVVSLSFSDAPRPSHLLALAVLYARLLRERDAPERALRPADVGGDLVLLAAVFLSTFRAATIAAALALLAAAWSSRRARWVLGLGTLLAALVAGLNMSSSREPSYANVVARDDWQARYAGVGDDRLSGRADIWENVWRDIADGPAWLLTGRGAGEVDMYVARVNPNYHAARRGGERAVHTHNTALELLLGAGVATLIPMLWIVALAVRRSRRDVLLVGCGAGLFVVSMSNVPMMDWTGGTLLNAVWLYGIARAGIRAPSPSTDASGPRLALARA